MTYKEYSDNVKAVLFGIAAGDALGVPVEFKSREELQQNPIAGMTGNGTHNQPAGTWSDDSAMTFCLAEVIAAEYTPESLAQVLVAWATDGYWTPRGSVFDIGEATATAITALKSGISPLKSGGSDVMSNGNGSLMRIAPLMFLTDQKPITKRWQIAREVSGITHAHFISVACCFYYLEFMRHIFHGNDKQTAYKKLREKLPEFFASCSIEEEEYTFLDRLLKGQISKLKESEIKSTGYVVDSLEAAIWCVMSEKSFEATVLKAVNLGGDTDTIASIAGAIAGLLYGYDAIPQEWLKVLARREDIEKLADKVTKKLYTE